MTLPVARKLPLDRERILKTPKDPSELYEYLRSLSKELTLMYEDIAAAVNSPMFEFQTFADNTEARAGGLTSGQLYKTSTGAVMVVY